MTRNRWIAAAGALVVVIALLALALVAGDDADPQREAAAPAVDADGDATTTTTSTTTAPDSPTTTEAPADAAPTTAAPTPEPAPATAPKPRQAPPATTATTESPVAGPPTSSAPPPAIRAECQETTAKDAFVRVCVTRPVAGQPATFTVEASGRLRDDCGSPVPDFGDGSQQAVCAIGCESMPPDPVTFERSYEHTYAKGGRYTATFRFPGCGESSGSDIVVAPLEVHVEG